MRRQVQALLDQDSSGGALEKPVLSIAAPMLRDGSIVAGSMLGPYQIVSRLGEGGMGTVYTARDTRLGRTVAVKMAHEEFTGRFQREARAISALNHPHICTLYDAGPDYLVMELVEGETLARRLEKGRISMAPLLRYGSEIADALSAAHAKGIVHRDLKPGNIMVTKSGIKVLDFGLARFAEGRDSAASQTETATTGGIVGTPAYMAPEQLEGKACDARTDIFALGLVLYEMATGRKAFRGDSPAALIAEIMRCEPALGELSPPQFAHLVERCLAKNPEDRWQSVRDLKLELDYQQRTPFAEPPRPRSKRRVWAMVAAGAVAMVVIAGMWYLGRGSEEPVVLPLTSYPGSEIQPALSPDGKQVAFAWNGEREENYNIWVKQIGTAGNALKLTNGSSNDSWPAWSPDGKWIAFLRIIPGGSDIYAVPASGGLERKLGTTNSAGVLDWSPDGQWLVIPSRASHGKPAGLALLSFETDEIRQITDPEPPLYEYGAAFSPQGQALALLRSGQILMMRMSKSWNPQGAASPIRVMMDRQISHFSWSADGRDLIFAGGYADNTTLWRVSASGGSAKRLAVTGESASNPHISARGDRLVFQRYSADYNIWSVQLGEDGQALGEAVKAFDSSKSELCPMFSPDGTKVAFESGRSGNEELWVCRSDGSECLQLTSFANTHAGSPAWSPDGNWIAFDVFRQSRFEIYIVNSNGGRPRLLNGADGMVPRWSANGQRIYFRCRDAASPTGFNLCRIPVAGGQPERLTRTGGSAAEETPDGKWTYYSGDQSQLGPATFLRRIPSSGGEPEEVLPKIAGRNFIVLEKGIWYLTPGTREGSLLQYYDFATKTSRTVYHTKRPASAGLTIAPDGRRILFSQIDQSPSSDLMLVEHFR